MLTPKTQICVLGVDLLGDHHGRFRGLDDSLPAQTQSGGNGRPGQALKHPRHLVWGVTGIPSILPAN